MNVDFDIDYGLAFARVADALTPVQKDLLVALYSAPPEEGVAAGLFAPVLGLRHHAPLNATIARIGKKLATAVGASPPQRADGSHRWWAVVATDRESPDGRFFWILRPQFRAVLANTGLVPRESAIFPDVVRNTGDAEDPLVEGASIRVSLNVYERNPVARRRCIEHFGATCCVCGFDFGAVYGPIAAGVIHVHHITPLSVAGGSEYVIDPLSDLRPVCPNCHVVLHRRDPPLTIDEARGLLARGSNEERSNNGLQQTPPARSLGRRS